MIKLIYCIRKRSDLTEQQFAEYWRTVHAPLGARIPGLRRLVQNHLRHVPGDPPPTFDGVAELWFEDEPSLLAARESPEWAASTADEANFIDAGSYGYLVAEEVGIALPTASDPNELSSSERAVLRSYSGQGASGFDRAMRLSLQYALGAGMFTAAAIVQHNPWWALVVYATFLAFLAIRLVGARRIAKVMPGIIAKYEARIQDLEKWLPVSEGAD